MFADEKSVVVYEFESFTPTGSRCDKVQNGYEKKHDADNVELLVFKSASIADNIVKRRNFCLAASATKA